MGRNNTTPGGNLTEIQVRVLRKSRWARHAVTLLRLDVRRNQVAQQINQHVASLQQRTNLSPIKTKPRLCIYMVSVSTFRHNNQNVFITAWEFFVRSWMDIPIQAAKTVSVVSISSGLETKYVGHSFDPENCQANGLTVGKLFAGGTHMMLSATLLMVVCQTSPPDKELVQSCAQGYLANLESFTKFRCDFEVARDVASTWEEATSPGFRPRNISKRKWLRDGTIEYYRQEMSENDRETVTNKNLIPVGKSGMAKMSLMTRHLDYLTDGEYQLAYDPLANVGIRDSTKLRNPEFYLTPFEQVGYGRKNGFAELAKNFERGLITLESCKRQSLNGVECLVFTFFRKDKDLRDEIWIDPNRGFLPMLQIYTEPQIAYECRIETRAVKELSNSRYFPMETVRLTRSRNSPRTEVSQLVVGSMTDRAPPRYDFKFTVPPRTLVISDSDRSSPYTHFRTKQEETIGVDDLPRIFDLTLLAASETQMDTAIKQPSTFRWYWIALGFVPVIVGYLLYYHRKRVTA